MSFTAKAGDDIQNEGFMRARRVETGLIRPYSTRHDGIFKK
jgi:hypothetical protein